MEMSDGDRWRERQLSQSSELTLFQYTKHRNYQDDENCFNRYKLLPRKCMAPEVGFVCLLEVCIIPTKIDGNRSFRIACKTSWNALPAQLNDFNL